MAAVAHCTKNGQPCREAQRASQKGKKLETQTFHDHASKENDNRGRQAVEHRPLPEFPPFRLNYRNEAALLRRTRLVGALRKLYLQRNRKSQNLSPRTSINHNDMNTDIDFMNIAEGDKAFVKSFENFVNGKVSSPEKTGRAMTAMHRYLQQQAFKVFMGYMKALAHNYRQRRYDDRNEWASRVAAEAYSHLIDKGLIYDPEFYELKNND